MPLLTVSARSSDAAAGRIAAVHFVSLEISGPVTFLRNRQPHSAFARRSLGTRLARRARFRLAVHVTLPAHTFLYVPGSADGCRRSLRTRPARLLRQLIRPRPDRAVVAVIGVDLIRKLSPRAGLAGVERIRADIRAWHALLPVAVPRRIVQQLGGVSDRQDGNDLSARPPAIVLGHDHLRRHRIQEYVASILVELDAAEEGLLHLQGGQSVEHALISVAAPISVALDRALVVKQRVDVSQSRRDIAVDEGLSNGLRQRQPDSRGSGRHVRRRLAVEPLPVSLRITLRRTEEGVLVVQSVVPLRGAEQVVCHIGRLEGVHPLLLRRAHRQEEALQGIPDPVKGFDQSLAVVRKDARHDDFDLVVPDLFGDLQSCVIRQGLVEGVHHADAALHHPHAVRVTVETAGRFARRARERIVLLGNEHHGADVGHLHGPNDQLRVLQVGDLDAVDGAVILPVEVVGPNTAVVVQDISFTGQTHLRFGKGWMGPSEEVHSLLSDELLHLSPMQLRVAAVLAGEKTELEMESPCGVLSFEPESAVVVFRVDGLEVQLVAIPRLDEVPLCANRAEDAAETEGRIGCDANREQETEKKLHAVAQGQETH